MNNPTLTFVLFYLLAGDNARLYMDLSYERCVGCARRFYLVHPNNVRALRVALVLFWPVVEVGLALIYACEYLGARWLDRKSPQ